MDEIVAAPSSLASKLIAELGDRDKELHRVARVLHEETGQILTVVGLQLDVLRQDFCGLAPELGERTTEIQELLEKAINGVRQLSYSMNPDRVQRSGLRYAMDLLVGKAREASGANIRFLMDSHVHLPLSVAVAFYKITEYALDNSVRHSGAQQIEIVLQLTGQHVKLEIKDTGKGFNVEEAERNPKGLGILWMRHFALDQGLELRISSRTGSGTAIHAVYRLPDESPMGG